MTTNRTQVTLSGVKKRMIVYMGADPQYRAKVEEGTPHDVPIGTVIRQKATWLVDVTTSDGKKLPGLEELSLEAGPREFLRGRLVEGDKAQQLLIPPEIRELQAMLGAMVVTMEGAEKLRVVAIKCDDIEVGIELRDGDVPPPKSASRYAVGQSPGELALTAEEAAQVQIERNEAQVRATAGVMGDDDPDAYDPEDEEAFAPEGIVEVDPTDPQLAQPEYGGESGN